MQSKLQELTKKIYEEGVEKGNAEAQQILEAARNEAATLISNAKNEAETILRDAQKRAAELKSNTESDIRLSARQSVNALKKQVTDLINGEITSAGIKHTFDKDFLKKIILTTLTNWAKSGENLDITLLLPSAEEKELSEFFKKEAKEFLNKGLTINFDNSLKSGFRISPKDGSYIISFTDEDFASYFRQFLRPRLIEFLFAD